MMSSGREMGYPPQGGQPMPMDMNAQPVPVVSTSPQPQIVVNQVTPTVAVGIPVAKSTPYLTVCPFCRNQVMTSSIRTFNICTCLLCWCTGLVCFCIIQSMRGKDIGCYDAEHRCPNCGKTIGMYESC